MKIVLISGGTGGSVTAGHFAEIWKEKPSEFDRLTVLQAPYDDWGHSGQIVREYGIFAPGDQRKVILALSKPWMDRDTYTALSRRNWHPQFEPGDQVRQPSMLADEPPLGNLIMLSAMLKYGKVNPGKALLEGIRVFADICRMPKEFRVIPTTLDPAVLTAELEDGTIISGQHNISIHHDCNERKIKKVYLVPPKGLPRPRLYEEARKAIMEADKIGFTSGSWRTSVWPNTLPIGFCDAIAESKAKLFMIVNVVTEKSESSQWNSGQFIDELQKVIRRPFHAILVHDWELDIKGWKKNIRHLADKNELSLLLEKHEGKELFLVQVRPPANTDDSGLLPPVSNIITGSFVTWDGKTFSHNKDTVRKILDL